MLTNYDASDEEILAYCRRNHDPYITLEAAKKHWSYSMRWWQFAKQAQAREKGIPLPWERDPAWAEDVRQAKVKHADERAQ